ncbi:MAG: hypothetical protein ABL995_01380 [Bryobacteraceae bacterium]
MSTEGQFDWAERIKTTVRAEFDRVENALSGVANQQQEQDRTETLAILAILEEKRTEVLGNSDPGYFIRIWQEVSDQVRRMLAEDARYQSIQAARRARKAGSIHAI